MAKIRHNINGLRKKPASQGTGNCILYIRNRSGIKLNLVIHGTDVKVVRAMTIRRIKRLKLIKGTYVLEAWLASGRIVINPHNIPNISIDKITSRKDVSFRGRKIIADFVNKRAKLEIDSEPTAGDLVENI
jgi:hypothetical protein